MPEPTPAEQAHTETIRKLCIVVGADQYELLPACDHCDGADARLRCTALPDTTVRIRLHRAGCPQQPEQTEQQVGELVEQLPSMVEVAHLERVWRLT